MNFANVCNSTRSIEVKKKEETDTKQIPGLSQTGNRLFDFEHWDGNVGNNLTFQLFFSRK
jgi:hypothetical protein